MGTFIQVLGVIHIIAGIIAMITIIGVPIGIDLIIGGIIYFVLGKIYNGIKEIKDKLGICI